MVNQRGNVVYAREGGFYVVFQLTALVLSLRPLYILARNDLQYCRNASVREERLHPLNHIRLTLQFTGAAIVER